MRSLSFLGGTAVIAAGLIVADPFATPAAAGLHDGGGIHWQHSQNANGYWREPVDRTSGGSQGSKPTVYIQYGPAGYWLECPDHDTAFACDEEGGELIEMLCGTPGGRGPNGLPEFAWIRYERELEPNGEPTKWVGKDGGCDEPRDDNFVSMKEISTHIDYRVFQPLGDPEVEVKPAGRTLVNVPTIVSTTYPEGVGPPAEVLSLQDARVRIPIDIEKPGENLTGEIIARAGFAWQFEDAGTATGRGRPYEQGRTPKDSPGYYTTGTFTTTGTKSINLTATWTGEVTVETLEPEQIEPVVRQTTATMDVVESRSRLSDGN